MIYLNILKNHFCDNFLIYFTLLLAFIYIHSQKSAKQIIIISNFYFNYVIYKINIKIFNFYPKFITIKYFELYFIY